MTADFHSKNRQRAIQSTGAKVLVFSAYSEMQRGNDAAFSFEQEANFWWLTGIEEPDWWVIIDTVQEKTWLVAPSVSDVHQVFSGSLSFEDAKTISGINIVLTHEEGEAMLAELAKDHREVAGLGEDPHASHYDFSLNPGPIRMLERLREIFETVEDCRKTLASLRAIKQPEEIESIRQAIALTIDAFETIRSNIKQYSYEYEIEADFTHYFRKNGAKGHAYDPIVAGGKNACTLHYGKNGDALVSGDLVLLDVGARYNGYAADITRTYAFKEVSDRHKAVHKAVEDAHQEIIGLLKPGADVREYHRKADEIMKRALDGLGLLVSKDDYRKYFPHAISHGLGVDVHDSLGGPETFLPGMVLTVEPGIYIPEEGIGVRIEDDILITETGHENLSAALSTSL
jgi:Xaa-Pro aminopeptidase